MSVVTVSYRDLAGLRATRASVLAQQYPGRVQHVIIDGGSGDAVADWLAQQQSDVSWVSEADDGIYHAMNKGIDRSEGDVLWFMNSADTFHRTDSLRTAMAALRRPRLQWGFGRAAWHRPGSREIDSVHGPRRYFRRVHALGRHTLPHQAVFFGADLIEQVGRYRADIGITADQGLMMRCARVAEPLVLSDILCNYDTGGVSSRQSPAEHWAAMRRARRLSGITVTGSQWIDDVLSRAWQAVAQVRRRVRPARAPAELATTGQET